MRRLMLLRHAKTEHDAPSGHDHDRRLDDRGRRDAAVIGDWIGRHPPIPDAVLVSTAVRAHQTWEIASAAMKDALGEPAQQPQVELLDELYGAEPTRLLKIIRMVEVNDPKRLMLIGHNPGMHELALMLTGSGDASAKKAIEDNLPTAGLAILDFAIDEWSEVAFRRGKLVRFTSPKLLKQTSDD
ncbi:MAG TPA: histidine phosphatase family protein [Bradyrhizobium sp.]